MSNLAGKTLLFPLLCAFTLSLRAQALWAQESAQDRIFPVYATVLTDNVNIRAGSGLNFEIIGRLRQGERVVAVGRQYQWYKIRLPETATAFVHQDYIRAGAVKANKLHVRAGPGSHFNVLGILKEGDKVTVLQKKDNWLRISPPADTRGWVKRDFLRLSSQKIILKKPKPLLRITRKPKIKKQKVQACGVIDDLGKIYNRQGTHKLIEDKRTIYYLKSDNIDLNKYVYRRVCVVGELGKFKDARYPVLLVEQITIK